MSAVVLLPVKYPYRLAVCLEQVAEEFAEPRLVLLFHFRSRPHVEAVQGDSVQRKERQQNWQEEVMREIQILAALSIRVARLNTLSR